MIQQRAFSVCKFITELLRVDIVIRADRLNVLVYVTGFGRLVFSLLNVTCIHWQRVLCCLQLIHAFCPRRRGMG